MKSTTTGGTFGALHNKVLLVLFATFLIMGVDVCDAQINVTEVGEVVNENFDTLGSSDGMAYLWTDNSTLSGWYWQSDGEDLPYIAEDGSNTTGSPYSYGADGSIDRAMGNLGGGDNNNTVWGVTLRNMTENALIYWTVSYAGEQWRSVDGQTEDGLVLAHKVSSLPIADFEHNAGAVPSGWTEVTALAFSDPQTSGGGAIDGNAAENRSILSESLTISVGLGEYIAFRWYDGNTTGSDNGHGIDDVVITASDVSPTSSGVDLRAYSAAEGVFVEFVAYDVESDGEIMLALLDDNGAVVWTGSVAALAGPEFVARFKVPGLEPGGTYDFKVRDEVGKWWTTNGVTVGGFGAALSAMSPAGATLVFDSQPGREYEVLWAAELSGEWTLVKTLTASGDRTSVVVEYPDGGQKAGFFRTRMK